MSNANELGYFAAQAISHTLKAIRVGSKNLDIENCTEEEILDGLDIINRASWEAKNAIERDIEQRQTMALGGQSNE